MKLNVVSFLPTIFIGAYKIRCLKDCQSNFITVAKLINLTDENVPIIVNGFNMVYYNTRPDTLPSVNENRRHRLGEGSYTVDFHTKLFTTGANGFVCIFSFDESLLRRKLIHVSTFMVENETKHVHRHTF